MRKVNVKINLLKGFACLAVIFIHITFPGKFGQIVLYASSYAVPVFFMITGYYAYGQDEQVIKRRLLKIFRIFCAAYALYFVFNIALAIKYREVIDWFHSYFNWSTPIKYIVFCTVDFAIPLWYLIAMIEVYVVWLLVVRREKEQAVVKVIPVLFILQILLNTYCETIGLDWFWKINFVTRGLSWFLLGYSLNLDEAKKLRSINSFTLIIFSVVGCLIAVMPVLCDFPIKFGSIGYIPYALGVFLLALKNPSNSICKPLEYIGGKLSLYVYIIHIQVSQIIMIVISHILMIDTRNTLFSWCFPVAVAVCTICLAYVMYNGKKTIIKCIG